MTRSAAPVPVTPVQGVEARVVLAVVIAGMALALAVAKPWAAGGGAAASSLGPGASSGADSSDAPATAATGASGDTPMSSGDAPVGPPGLLLVGAGRGVIPLPGGGTLDCADPQGWRVVLDATTDGLATRTWVAVVPGPGTGPLDPTLPLARIASGPVEGLGFCAPVTTVGGTPTAWTVGVWRVDRGASGAPRATRLARIGPGNRRARRPGSGGWPARRTSRLGAGPIRPPAPGAGRRPRGRLARRRDRAGGLTGRGRWDRVFRTGSGIRKIILVVSSSSSLLPRTGDDRQEPPAPPPGALR